MIYVLTRLEIPQPLSEKLEAAAIRRKISPTELMVQLLEKASSRLELLLPK